MKHKKQTIAWAVTTGILGTLMITVGVLSNGHRVLDNLLTTVFGGERAITADDDSEEGEHLYNKTTESKEAARANGNKVTQEINEEGIVLIKNDHALPLAEGSKISVFGKNSVNPVYGGSGSVAGGDDKSDFIDIYTGLTDAGFKVNTALKDFYNDNGLSGDGRKVVANMDGGGDGQAWLTGETPIASYPASVKATYSEYNAAAVVVLARTGGEGNDLPRNASDHAENHYLELDDNEKDLLNEVCSAGFQHVIVVVNSNNPMELGFLNDPADPNYHAQIDGALICGGFGSQGAEALGKILCGSVNPSGHTVDIYAKDFTKDPTYQNFGDGSQVGLSAGDRYVVGGKKKQFYFVDYEEGVYVGYRYYETRHLTETASGNSAWYEQNVAFPYGYGLSYSEFNWTVENKAALTSLSSSKFTINVNVKNVSDVAGKDVVEVYGEAPYTAGGIEKSAKVLVGFAKTDTLSKNDDQTLEIEIDPYYLASFDYNDKNGNGFKGYELEAGEYNFYVSTDSHNSLEKITMNLAEGIRYENDPVTGKPVECHFSDRDAQLSTVLSRNDWTSTWPTPPTDEERSVSNEFLDELKDHTHNNPNVGHEYPTTGADNGLVLADFVQAEWNDPRWEALLDECTAQEMYDLFYNGAFRTVKMDSIAKPATTNADGPQGFTVFMGDPTVYGTNVYPSEPVVAATFNVKLAEKEGEAIGEEGLWGDVYKNGTGLPYSGIYAPGVNIHRSPFGGRLGEYYSEDPFHNGMMSAGFTAGARNKGVITYTKHFVGNEQETHRSMNGDITWVNEQALREIYLRPFELNVKVGHTLGIMTSFNRIGKIWAGADYYLNTVVLKEEWGFHGAIISDFSSGDYMNTKQMLYAGGNLNLATYFYDEDIDKGNADDVYYLRQSTKEVLYSVVHSNVVDITILGYLPPIWKVTEYSVMGGIGALLLGWGALILVLELRRPKAL